MQNMIKAYPCGLWLREYAFLMQLLRYADTPGSAAAGLLFRLNSVIAP